MKKPMGLTKMSHAVLVVITCNDIFARGVSVLRG